MIFSKRLLRYWIAFDQPGVLHVGLLVIEKFEKEESNHCAALPPELIEIRSAENEALYNLDYATAREKFTELGEAI